MSKHLPRSIWAAHRPVFSFCNLVVLCLVISLGALSGCDDKDKKGGDNIGGQPTEPSPQGVASISISPATWNANRIGQRQQFTATALDAEGNPIPDTQFTWRTCFYIGLSVECSAQPPNRAPVTSIDDTGFVTALSTGSGFVEVMAGDTGAVAQLHVISAIPSTYGDMYTVWFALHENAPAILTDGKLMVPNIYGSPRTPVSPWYSPLSEGRIEKFQWEGNRIGILSDMAEGLGAFRVMDRDTEWTLLVTANTADFQLEGNRIGVLINDRALIVKDGIHGAWTKLETTGVKKFLLSGNRIGVLREDGVLRVKTGIHGAWTVLATSGVRDFQFQGNRTGVLLDNGDLLTSDNLASQPLARIETSIQQFQIYQSPISQARHIGALLENGTLRVYSQIGARSGQWQDVAAGVREFQLENRRVGVQFEDGSFKSKDGYRLLTIWRWTEDWVTHATGGVQAFQLQGTRLGILTDTNQLRVRSGSFLLNQFGGWFTTPAYAEGVSHFQLLVAVPLPPVRTTPASYQAAQPGCHANQPTYCYAVSEFAVPVAYYGRFCGMGVPVDLAVATRVGPLDSFDALCQHHDKQHGWYPNTWSSGCPEGASLWDLTTNPDCQDTLADGACIVRYGINHAKLTSYGRVITKDSANWDVIWGRMWNMYDAITNYDWYTSVCTDDRLAEFTRETGGIPY
ncbi:MAG: hypothetical protein OEY67_04910 [Gammaproteobacteria bacterium]|nr:hypothetical protein [Gammaproteobacteria bacterium]